VKLRHRYWIIRIVSVLLTGLPVINAHGQTNGSIKLFSDSVISLLEADKAGDTLSFREARTLAHIRTYEEAMEILPSGMLECDLHYFLAINCYELASNLPEKYSAYYDKAITYLARYCDKCVGRDDSATRNTYDSLGRVIIREKAACQEWLKIKDSQDYSVLAGFIEKYKDVDEYCRRVLKSWNFSLAEYYYKQAIQPVEALDRFYSAFQYEISGPGAPEGLSGMQAFMIREGRHVWGFYLSARANRENFRSSNNIDEINKNCTVSAVSSNSSKQILALSLGVVKNIHKSLYISAGVGLRRERMPEIRSISFNGFSPQECRIYDKNEDRYLLSPEIGLIVAGRTFSANAGLRYYTNLGHQDDRSSGPALYMGIGVGMAYRPKPFYIMYNNYYRVPLTAYLTDANSLKGFTIGAVNRIYFSVAANRCFLKSGKQEASEYAPGLLITSLGYNKLLQGMLLSVGYGVVQQKRANSVSILKSNPEIGAGIVFHRLILRLTMQAPAFNFTRDNIILSYGIGFNFFR